MTPLKAEVRVEAEIQEAPNGFSSRVSVYAKNLCASNCKQTGLSIPPAIFAGQTKRVKALCKAFTFFRVQHSDQQLIGPLFPLRLEPGADKPFASEPDEAFITTSETLPRVAGRADGILASLASAGRNGEGSGVSP